MYDTEIVQALLTQILTAAERINQDVNPNDRRCCKRGLTGFFPRPTTFESQSCQQPIILTSIADSIFSI